MIHYKYAGKIMDNISAFLVGKNDVVELSIITLLAGGHLLIEDVPGVGKTTLANLLAASVDCDFARIQFTPDTLPGDVIGASVFNMKEGEFLYVPGAIMHNIVLVDEINRASPKTQSALLESMQEQQVTVDKVTYLLPDPFMIIATQNPIEFVGTHNLPEAQLDRFLMKLSIGYPDIHAERLMSNNYVEGYTALQAKPVLKRNELICMRQEVQNVFVCEEIIQYIVKLITATRESKWLTLGGSPRATLGFISAARACAYVNGRDFVTPDDVQKVIVHVLSHRLVLTVEARMNKKTPQSIIADIVRRVKVPI
ncbi:MAG: MoxR family ATPase [Lachnospiraceae bacterium]|nr:MoxR family ATPase [Lachnospiraceae bacterium]